MESRFLCCCSRAAKDSCAGQAWLQTRPTHQWILAMPRASTTSLTPPRNEKTGRPTTLRRGGRFCASAPGIRTRNDHDEQKCSLAVLPRSSSAPRPPSSRERPPSSRGRGTGPPGWRRPSAASRRPHRHRRRRLRGRNNFAFVLYHISARPGGVEVAPSSRRRSHGEPLGETPSRRLKLLRRKPLHLLRVVRPGRPHE